MLLLLPLLLRELPRELLLSLPVDVQGNAPNGLGDDAEFAAHLQQNIADHEQQCAAACASYFCGEAPSGLASAGLPAFEKFSMGPMPSLDFPAAFPAEEAIHVSKAPIFTAAECERVIELAEREGLGLPSTKSGKYRIGKAWIEEMPGVLEWFNGALASTLFPIMSALFPQLVPSTASLRAHKVAQCFASACLPEAPRALHT
jgi:hypothetical protein